MSVPERFQAPFTDDREVVTGIVLIPSAMRAYDLHHQAFTIAHINGLFQLSRRILSSNITTADGNVAEDIFNPAGAAGLSNFTLFLMNRISDAFIQ
jgi:hypothetical protein